MRNRVSASGTKKVEGCQRPVGYGYFKVDRESTYIPMVERSRPLHGPDKEEGARPPENLGKFQVLHALSRKGPDTYRSLKEELIPTSKNSSSERGKPRSGMRKKRKEKEGRT